jgi:peptidoglycan DL-endopeptidase CwlO
MMGNFGYRRVRDATRIAENRLLLPDRSGQRERVAEGSDVRDLPRRLRTGLWIAVAAGVVASLSPRIDLHDFAGGASRTGAAAASAGRQHSASWSARQGAASSRDGRLSAAALAGLARERDGETESEEATRAGIFLAPSTGRATIAVPVAQLTAIKTTREVSRLRRLVPADVLVVAPRTLPGSALRAVRRLHGVTEAELLDAARIKVGSGYVPVLGVDPPVFRAFAAAPTARSTALWQSVADGEIAVSYLMGQQEKLPLGGEVAVTGARTERLRVGGFGTVGISGVDAVVSDQVARSLGMPAGNAIVMSAPHATLSVLVRQLGKLLPKDASVVPLVAQAAELGPSASSGAAGAIGITASDGPGLTATQTRAFLTAAKSRLGDPYVWGAAGPNRFDCSGLVQWSMRQAGIIMPRVAVDQAQTGPRIPVSQVQPGDLLFYHTDPTAPTYISHVAIYIGDGLMLQAPEPGLDVEVVPAILGGPEFAGAIAVYPKVAAAVAAEFSS